jgi:hypothetical protein
MIHVILYPTGRGVVGLPGRSVPLEANSIAGAREQAIAVLTAHAAVQALPVEVEADDDGTPVKFSVHPDGRINVHREGAGAYVPKPVGPSQVPAPMSPPEAYVPASSEALATPIDVDPTPPPLPVPPSPEEQVAIVTAAAEPKPADWSPNPELPDDIETTIRRGASGVNAAQLDFTTGDTFIVTENTVFGRSPSVEPGEPYQLATINDTKRSVSKSHFSAIWFKNEFLIVDISSANGTTVYPGGGTTGVHLTPGYGHILLDGDRVEVGDESFTVHLAKLTKE